MHSYHSGYFQRTFWTVVRLRGEDKVWDFWTVVKKNRSDEIFKNKFLVYDKIMFKQLLLVIITMFSLVLAFIFVFYRSNSKDPLVGELSRQQLERAFAHHWPALNSPPGPHQEASLALGKVPHGATLSIYLGTWCSDSARELSRFWRALDMLDKEPLFQVRYIGVDRNKWAPQMPLDLELNFVPTFVVSREGREQGRIVESAPRGIEIDLKELLTGELHGAISGRADPAEHADHDDTCNQQTAKKI